MSTTKSINVKGLLGYKLKKTQHALRLHMDEALRTIKLTTPQYAVLAQLELKGGRSNAELARRSFITAQTMHGIVSNLEKRGLIIRKNSLTHGRILCTKLTQKGQKVVAKANKMIQAVETRMLSTINNDHKILLEKLLIECFNNLQDEEKSVR